MFNSGIGALIQRQPMEKHCDTYDDSIKNCLMHSKQMCIDKLAEDNAALEALEKNPELLKTLELLKKTGCC